MILDKHGRKSWAILKSGNVKAMTAAPLTQTI